jgi:hypothetical protein
VLSHDVGDIEAQPPGAGRAMRHSAQPVLRSRSRGLLALASTTVETRA